VVILIIKAQLRPEKRREFLQSARSLAALEVSLFQSVDDEDSLILLGHWASEREAEEYAASEAYRALRGSLGTLCECSELEWVRGDSASEALVLRSAGTNREG